MAADYEMAMKKLIKTVVRTFYEPCHIVICDILLENVLLNDTEFCGKMKMLSREFNKLIIKLKEERIVKSEIKMETREDNKQYLKNVYFFDYAEVKDIVKYKIFQMTKSLEVKRNADEEAFYCKSCDKSFSALDAQACIVNFVFKCIFCKNDLVENVKNTNTDELGLKELLAKMNGIISLLKEADKFDIPTMDYFQVLELKKEKEKLENTVVEEKTGAPTPSSFLVETMQKDDDSDEFMVTKASPEQVNAQESFDQMVTVNGKPKKYSEICEIDLDQMTEDEYSLYYEIHMKNNPDS